MNPENEHKDEKTNKFPSAVCISFDRLHLGFLGAYGNTWIRTPSFDELAANSVLFDRFYANSLDLAAIFESIWGELPENLSASGVKTILLSDESEVAHHRCASGFSELVLIDEPSPVAPPRKPEDTRFYKMFANALELLEEAERPFFLWVHLRGFGGPWDFPYKYRLEYREEDDPEPYSATAVPWADRRDIEDPDPDELRAVLETYAGGIRLFDELLGGFLHALESDRDKDDRPLFLLCGTRGFPMGEHGIIGLNESKTGPADLFWSENLHLPLLLHFPGAEFASVRSNALAVPGDLNITLREWFGENPPKLEIEREISGGESSPMSLFPAIREETGPKTRKRIAVESKNDEKIRAVISQEWFLRVISGETSERHELFVKPDDRFELNEVASRCEEALNELLAGNDS